MPTLLQKNLSEALIFIRGQAKIHPRIGLTLGSGLSSIANQVKDAVRIPFSEIPHFSPPTVEGHSGHLVLGNLAEAPVAVLQGRVHYYEGHDPQAVAFPTRVLAELGVQCLILTNAAGGLVPSMHPGDLMILNEHINLTGMNPLRGPNPEFLGPRFPDMTNAYDMNLRKQLGEIFRHRKIRFSEGVYCGVSGPNYETAAEVRFLQIIGAQAVGMSTVAETIAARHAGLKVVGVSCITNLATGIAKHELSHNEVKEVAQKVEGEFAQALTDFVGAIKEHFV